MGAGVTDVPRDLRNVDDEGLSPLERALISRFEEGLKDLTSEVRALRRMAPDRTLLYVLGCLWTLSMFAVGILALERGVDPRVAAQAVQALGGGK